MAADFEIRIDRRQVQAFLNELGPSFRDKLDRAYGRTAAEAKRIILPRIPKDKGRLRQSYAPRRLGFMSWQFYSTLGDPGLGGTPYGVYQERGFTTGRVENYTTPGTGARFIENSVPRVQRQLNENIDAVLREVSG